MRFEDPGFEKLFAVYSTNLEQAMRLVTPSLRTWLREAADADQRRFCVSFSGRFAILVLQNDGDQFRPSMFRTPVRFAPVLDQAQLLDAGLQFVSLVK